MIMCFINFIASILIIFWIQTPRTIPKACEIIKEKKYEIREIYTIKLNEY